MEWLTQKIPVGQGAAAFFDWLQENGEVVFDAISTGLGSFIDGLMWLMQAPSPFVVIGLFVALTWISSRFVVGLIL